MKKTIAELQYLLHILFNVYHTFERSYGRNHKNYFTYKRQVFEHELRGRYIVEKLIHIDFKSTLSEHAKQKEYYSETFAEGKCAIIDEKSVSFHYEISQTLFVYTAYLLKNDLKKILDYLRSDQLNQKFFGFKIVEGCLIYSSMDHEQIWKEIENKLEYPNYTYYFLFKIGQYVRGRNASEIEVQIRELERLITDYLRNYDFSSFDRVMLDNEAE